MASEDAIDYKALFLQEERRREQAEKRQQEAEGRQQEAEERQQEAEERQQEAEERQQEAEERQQEAEGRQRQAEERNQPTTFDELIRSCHNLLSLTLRVQAPAFSTKGSIPKPTGKFCPVYLRPWLDCSDIQDRFYHRVRSYFQPTDRLFCPRIELEGIGRRCSRPLSSELDLGFYERIAVEQHVQDIITELCKRPEARAEFSLGEGVAFENHTNIIEEDEDTSLQYPRRSIPDQFCIHRSDDGVSTLLTTVEYKPPHKLPVEYLRSGLRPMNLWEEVVQRGPMPKEENAKLKCIAEQISASVLVQEFDVMINEGLEYSYITNGLAYVLLYVDRNEPEVLYYFHCEPNLDVEPTNVRILQPNTAITRVLCLCLMSCLSDYRDQAWRDYARERVKTWQTDLDYERAQIPETELRKTPPGSEYVPSSPPSSSPIDSHQPVTRSRASCAPQSTTTHPSGSIDSDSDPDSQQEARGRKRNLSELTSLPPNQRLSRQRGNGGSRGGPRQHTAPFCTQKCLLGLQQGDYLDENCPNVESHRTDNRDKHPIDTNHLVSLIKKQLDKTLDQNCSPFGNCGSYGAPFKITCYQYGYTVVGKGTTSRRWNEVRREAVVYRFLRRAQGSAVPVFLGCIDLKMIYYLHGAGAIKHMLLMGWGGEDTSKIEGSQQLDDEISRSKKEIRAMGVDHQDLKPNNILWNAELGRALIIDFHRSRLIAPVIRNRNPAKRSVTLDQTEDGRDKKIGKRSGILSC
ncbi:hypothetical protein McanCB56680_004681 [Microsporum canis]|uniref:Protein kinase domain-containing protein n=1 Tax=Arthroderma otae (strain ATCC MYA-4605 / CBS 113480) TaxID=554155 RepID=C5FZM6_ARTOC|nr:conserved hypothetical protein [Microsporum canis CBS 113480]EEQ35329.1 conserved hypothetical protein [Microsporum canis CBS 113480]